MADTLDITTARDKFNTLDSELRQKPVIYITRHGKEAFAVVDIEYLETMIETMEVLGDPEATRLLEDSVRAIEAGELIDQEDVEKELG